MTNKRTTTVVESRRRIGRNQPCPCGSGRKYKRCCYRMETTPDGRERISIDAHASDAKSTTERVHSRETIGMSVPGETGLARALNDDATPDDD